MTDPTLTASLSERASLAKLIENLSDEEMNKLAEAVGMPALFEMVIAALVSRFEPERAAGQNAVVQWDVTDAAGETHSFVLTVEDGKMTGEVTTSPNPRMTLGMPIPVFLQFLAGTVDPMQAFMGGQLTLAGDMSFALSFQTWIRTD